MPMVKCASRPVQSLGRTTMRNGRNTWPRCYARRDPDARDAPGACYGARVRISARHPTAPFGLRNAGRALLGLCLALGLSSCDGGESACTELDCVNTAIVTLPAGLVSGPYELTLSNGSDMDTFFCSDPQQAGQNPEGVVCDGARISIEGPFAARSSVSVSMVDANGDTIISRQDVTLESIETVQPNGPDCDPTCVTRSGRILP